MYFPPQKLTLEVVTYGVTFFSELPRKTVTFSSLQTLGFLSLCFCYMAACWTCRTLSQKAWFLSPCLHALMMRLKSEKGTSVLPLTSLPPEIYQGLQEHSTKPGLKWIVFCLFVFEKGSHCVCSLGWHETHYADEPVFKLTDICLVLSTKC